MKRLRAVDPPQWSYSVTTLQFHEKTVILGSGEVKLVTQWQSMAKNLKVLTFRVSWAAACVVNGEEWVGEAKLKLVACVASPVGRCFLACRGSSRVPVLSVLWAALNQTSHIPTSNTVKGRDSGRAAAASKPQKMYTQTHTVAKKKNHTHTHTHPHLRVNLCVFLRPTAACRLNAVSTLTVVYNIYLPLRQQLTSGKTKTQTAFTRIRAGLLTVWPSLSVYCHSDQRGRHPHNTGPAYQRSEDSDLWMHTGLHEGHQGETMAVPHNLAPPPSRSYPPLSSSQKLAC